MVSLSNHGPLTLLLATRNPKKARELRQLLRRSRSPQPFHLLTLDRFPEIPPVREDGQTFRANAVKKAVETSCQTILPVLAEDSGLEVWALQGQPGVRSARYAGDAQDDRANIRLLLRRMERIPDSRRQARFVSFLALGLGGQLIKTFQGTCSGSVAPIPRGKFGFGYDPVFIPRGFHQTMAQLGPTIKNSLSHRASAVQRFLDWLVRRYPGTDPED